MVSLNSLAFYMNSEENNLLSVESIGEQVENKQGQPSDTYIMRGEERSDLEYYENQMQVLFGPEATSIKDTPNII